MFVFLIKIIHFLTDFLLFIIIIDAVLSFFKLEKTYKLIESIKKISNIIQKPIRSNIKNIDLGFDISPILAIIFLKIIEAVIIGFFKLFI